MKNTLLNNIKTFIPSSKSELIDYAFRKKKILIAINAEKILNRSSIFKNIVNSNVGYPDGFGAVLALKKKGFHNSFKIPGCELWLQIVSNFYKSKSFYLIGGNQRVLEGALKRLRSDFKGINILGSRNGYFKDENQKKIVIEDIVKKSPDIIFVAMGSPNQEYFMFEIQKRYEALYQGLGGSLDVYVGDINRAPKFMIDNNLEWAYRLIKQPFRIFRQIHLFRFFVLLKLNRI